MKLYPSLLSPLLCVLSLLIGPPAIAQQLNQTPICQYLNPQWSPGGGLQVNKEYGLQLYCFYSPADGRYIDNGVARLFLRLIQDNAALQKEVAELKTTLAEVSKLGPKLEEESKKNQAWREDALDKNLRAISEVPAAIAQDKILRQTLAAMLTSDPEFIEALRKALKK